MICRKLEFCHKRRACLVCPNFIIMYLVSKYYLFYGYRTLHVSHWISSIINKPMMKIISFRKYARKSKKNSTLLQNLQSISHLFRVSFSFKLMLNIEEHHFLQKKVLSLVKKFSSELFFFYFHFGDFFLPRKSICEKCSP